jgi:hypothetical protein
VRGAINNGLTKEEIQEVFLQVAIYCGVPAAIDSFRVAKEVFKEMGLIEFDESDEDEENDWPDGGREMF